MNHNSIELKILIKGRPITEYSHRGQIFVEGRDGSEYEIEIRNDSYGRVEAVLSVDGLSVTDGKAAGQQSTGYMIEPRSTVRVPGWTLDNQSIAKFAFASKQQSYATQMTGGDARNNGVIGVMAFAEKIAYRYTPPPIAWQNNRFYQPLSTGIAASASGTTSNGYMQNASYNCASANYYSLDAVASCSMSQPADREEKTAGGLIQEQSLGTAFGEALDFKTTTVEFVRGDMVMMAVIYYDEARGLKARGIQMTRPSKAKYQQKPDAFPAMQTGCVPPPNWRG